MNPSPFDDLSQRLLAEQERVQRMVRDAQPLGERIARELEQADRLNREMARMDAFTRPAELAEAITRETKAMALIAAAMPNVAEITMREIDRAAQVGKLTADIACNFSSSIPDLVSLSTSAARDAVEDIQKRSAELSKVVSEVAKPAKLPDNWMDNLSFTRPDYTAKLSKFKFPKDCTLAKLQRMSDDQIRDFLDGYVSIKATQLALHELAQRRLDRISSKITRVEVTIKKVDRQNTRTQRLVIILAVVAITVGALQCVIAWIK